MHLFLSQVYLASATVNFLARAQGGQRVPSPQELEALRALSCIGSFKEFMAARENSQDGLHYRAAPQFWRIPNTSRTAATAAN